MGLIEQLILAAFIGFGALLWLDAAQAMRTTQDSLTRSGQRIDYAEAALKDIHRETQSLKRLQKEKAGLKQCDARLSEATALLLSKKDLVKEVAIA